MTPCSLEGVGAGARIYPVILCGGLGTRLWPLSHPAMPKPFLPLLSRRSVFQETLLRQAGIPGLMPPVVVCNEAHEELANRQMRDIDCEPFMTILEPCRRNTGPAAVLAALALAEEDREAVVLILPADHRIGDHAAYRGAVAAGLPAAAAGRVVALGAPARSPDPALGYILAGQPIGDCGARQMDGFVEKPQASEAAELLATGRWRWNCGIYVATANGLAAQCARHCPDILSNCHAAMGGAGRCGRAIRPAARPFGMCRSVSFDDAVMAVTEAGAIVGVDMDWEDIGNADALARARSVAGAG